MTWGVPPKIEIKFHLPIENRAQICNHVKAKLDQCGFEVFESGQYMIQAKKKMRLTFMSAFALSRPKITLIVLLPDSGVIALRASYDYDSITGIAMNDLGRMKLELSELKERIETH